MLNLYKHFGSFGSGFGLGFLAQGFGVKTFGDFQKLVQYRSGSLKSHDHIDPFAALGTTVWIHEFVAFLGFSFARSLKHLKYSARYSLM